MPEVLVGGGMLWGLDFSVTVAAVVQWFLCSAANSKGVSVHVDKPQKFPELLTRACLITVRFGT